MAYKYFTKELLGKSGEIDLSTIFADKQQRAKELLNTNYSLPQIADWIRDSTNNFKSQEGYFIDLDLAVRKLVERYYESTNTPNPFVSVDTTEIEGKSQPRASVEVSSKVTKTPLPEISTATDKVEAVDDEINSLKEAIDYLKDEADAGDEEAKEALEYLKDELSALSKQI